jgi:ubiquinone/menaquinone biosynthesis C-methylase UbiE
MRITGEIVGPSDSVTGLDIDGRLGREALDVLRTTGGSTFDFIEGNAETIADPLARRSM